MQDLDDDHRVGRRRLSAIQGERGTPTVTPQDAPLVPAQRLLKVATALSEGATRLHAQLRHLEPAERDALLELVADQVTDIVSLWADLVRGVVSSDKAASGEPAAKSDASRLHGGTPLEAQRQARPAGDHPARLTTALPDPARARARRSSASPWRPPRRSATSLPRPGASPIVSPATNSPGSSTGRRASPPSDATSTGAVAATSGSCSDTSTSTG